MSATALTRRLKWAGGQGNPQLRARMGAPRPQTAVNVNSRTIRAVAAFGADAAILGATRRLRGSQAAQSQLQVIFSSDFFASAQTDRARDQAQR